MRRAIPGGGNDGTVPRVLHVMPDAAIGGGQRVVLEYLRHADRERFDPHVALISGAGGLHGAFDATRPFYLDFERGRGVRNALRLARLIREERIDLLHVHGGVTQRYGQSAALVTGTPVVAHLHSVWISTGISARDPRRWVADRGLAWAEHRTISHYIACTEAVRRVYEPHVRAPIAVVDNGVTIPSVDGRAGTRSDLRESLALRGDARVILNVGVLEPRKRVDTLIEMMRLLAPTQPHAVLVVAGEGSERSHLEAQAAAAGVDGRVRLLGSRHDITDLLLAADVFAFASEREGLPLAVLEAMAAGLPVVSSRLPALQELVADGVDGLLVEAGDARGFALAVERLLDDCALAHDVGSAARRKIAARFDAADMARSFEAVYDVALARSPTRAPSVDAQTGTRGTG